MLIRNYKIDISIYVCLGNTLTNQYERKKIDNALQAITLGEKDSDCKTTFGLKIVIPAKMKNLFLDRYILNQDGSLLLLSANNIDEYVDKEVILRSHLFCKTDCICNKCAGEFFYKMGITNAGLLTNTMARCANECLIFRHFTLKNVLKTF